MESKVSFIFDDTNYHFDIQTLHRIAFTNTYEYWIYGTTSYFTLSETTFSFTNKVGFITSTVNNRRTTMLFENIGSITITDSGTLTTSPVAQYTIQSMAETMS